MANLDMFHNDPSLRALKAGEVVFSAGDQGDAMYVVVEGSVDIILPDGTVVATVAPGGIFGEMAIVDGRERSATATAKEASKVAPINTRRFTYLVQNTPFFAIEVMRTMAERLRTMDAKGIGPV
ncbi:cyclic nucleotide-binding protein [Vulcanimicrobium alpinum]|uniref:Cyclic nucleotide-binding protein n=1 Tax=Vulcanimicrobium alpinum TaxID=3016050 RepID=A0AAN2C7Q0_UNVUL|nr:cyclic nucleotide-binding protein [Vulcanimicrobium alpinum]